MMQPQSPESSRASTRATEPLPRVSVGMPVYNGATYIRQAIDGILDQTFSDFELVICDNASTDETQQICLGYAASDSRVRYFRNPKNLGGSPNFGRVFELSRAPYFKWAAHDDLCAATFLERGVAVLDARREVVLCYPRSAFIDAAGHVIADHAAACHLRSAQAPARVAQFLTDAHTHCFPMFGLIRREALAKTCLVAPYISSDQILLLQLAIQGQFAELPDTLFYFREHPERSVWQSKTFAGTLSWYDTSRRTRIQLPRCRLVLEFCRSIHQSDLSPSEALESYLSVMRWCKWHWAPIARDLKMASVQLLRSIAGLSRLADKDGAPPIQASSTSPTDGLVGALSDRNNSQ